VNNELLLFELRSIADGVDKGFKQAEKAAQDMGKAYDEVTKQENRLSDAIKDLTQQLVNSQKALADDNKELKRKITELEAVNKKLQASSNAERVNMQALLQSQNTLQQQIQAEKQRTASLEKLIKQIESKIKKQQEEEAQEQKQRQEAMSQVVAIGALIGAYAGLKRGLDSATKAYIENRSAMVGLRSIVENTGGSFGQAQKAVEDFTSDGLIPIADASTALKNLLSRGFGMEEAIDIMNRFKDSAAFGRQASLELGEAVKTATEGIKNENSILVDNAGVTKNVSVMWKEYAAELGIGVQELTIAQKRQAEYNGIMQETQHQVGDAKKLSGEFAGSQAALTASTTQLKVALGEAATGGLTPLNQGLAKGVQAATELVKGFSPLISGVIQGTKIFIGGSVAALLFSSSLSETRKQALASIPVLNAATGSLTALRAAMTSPLGIAAGVLAGVIGVIVGISSASNQAAEDMQALNDEVQQLGSDVGGASALVDRFEELKNKASLTKDETAEMNKISEDLVATYGFRADGISEEGKELATNLDLMKEQLEVQREMLRLKLQEAETNNAEQYKEAQENLVNTRAELIELQSANDSYRKSWEEVQNGIYNATEEARKMGYAVQDIDGNLELSDPTGWFNYLETNAPFWDDAEQEMLERITGFHEAINMQISNSVDLAKITAEARGQEIPHALMNSINEAMVAISQEDPEAEMSSDTALNFIDRYFDIEDAAGLAESKVEEINQLRQMIFSELATSETDVAESGQLAKDILGSITDEDTLSEALRDGQELRKKIEEGVASQQDKTAWNAMRTQVESEINQLKNEVQQAGANMDFPVDGILDSLTDLANGFEDTAAEIEKAALDKKVADMSMGDFIGEVESAAGAANSLRQEMADWADLQSAIDIVREGAENSEYYADALAWLADRYGVSEEAALSSLDTYQADANMTSVLIDIKMALADAELVAAQATISAMQAQGNVTESEANRMIASLQAVQAQLQQLNGTKIALEEAADGKSAEVKVFGGGTNLFTGSASSYSGYSSQGGRGGGSGSRGGRGGGSGSRGGRGGGSGSQKTEKYKNQLYDDALAALENKKHYDQLTLQQERDMLNKIYNSYAQTAEEKSEINKRLWTVQKEQMDANISYNKSMNKLTIAEEIKLVEQKRNLYGRDTQAWRDANAELYQLRVQQRRQIFDNDVYFGRLTLERQREWLKQEIKLYKKGTEARIELEKELHDTLQQIRERDVQHIDTYVDAINSAVRERYNVQRQAEEQKLNNSIKQWQEWASEQQKAIQAQIAALDELTKTEDREEQERKRKRDIAALEQRIQYENDLYNRQKLIDELQKKEEEFSKWQKNNERQDLKDALNAQAQAVQEMANAEQDRLQEQLDATGKYYDQLSKDSAIQAQTEQILLRNNQTEIINLLKSYAPEYDTIGQTLGEKLVDGFTKQVGSIDTWFNNLNKRIATYQNQMGSAANQAANQYWSSRGTAVAVNPNQYDRVDAPNNQQTLHIYFNQPVESPSEVTRELERLADNLRRM
jgi:uncharacterized membrane protein YqgA involved in biofilm formation